MTIPYLNTARPVPMSDIPEEYRDIAEAIGLEAFTQLTLLCGGQSLYIPKRESLERNARDRDIRARFNGCNYRALAVQFRQRAADPQDHQRHPYLNSAYRKSLFAPHGAGIHRRPMPNSGHCVFAVWGPSSKQARFIRHRRHFACFPFLGYLRTKSRLVAVALRNAPAGAVPHTPFTRKGYAASVKR